MLHSCVNLDTLSPEVVLKIVEFMDYEPTLFESLRNTSTWLRDLVSENERSLSWHFAQQLHVESTPLISSTVRRVVLSPCSFKWLAELHFRESIREALVSHYILKTKHGQFSFLDSRLICEVCQDGRMKRLKVKTLGLLFSISDCGAYYGESRRLAQEKFLEQLNEEDLAWLITLLSLVSKGYTASQPAEGSVDLTGVMQISHRAEVVEKECVYRELVLQYGTFFIWASTYGGVDQKEWVKNSIELGMKVLRGYENALPGTRDNYTPSLQSILLKVFCAKTRCDILDNRSIHQRVDDIVIQEISDENNGSPLTQ